MSPTRTALGVVISDIVLLVLARCVLYVNQELKKIKKINKY